MKGANRIPTSKKTAVVLAGVLFVALIPFAWVFGTIGYMSFKEYRHRIPFDGVAWKAAETGYGAKSVRVRMIDDLTKHHKLIGLSREEVVKLLGEPVPTSKIGEYVARGFKEDIRESDSMYWLGVRNLFFNFNAEWLLLRFDDAGTVSEYKILRDDTRKSLNIFGGNR